MMAELGAISSSRFRPLMSKTERRRSLVQERRGHSKGGKKRAANVSPERRAAIAKKVAAKRWAKQLARPPPRISRLVCPRRSGRPKTFARRSTPLRLPGKLGPYKKRTLTLLAGSPY
jgi:hypothetical protein